MSQVPPTTVLDHTIAPTDLVELVHHQTTGRTACVVGIDGSAEEVELCIAPIPERFDHPGDALVGLVAPAAWFAIGLSVPVRARRIGTDDPDLHDDADPLADVGDAVIGDASRLTVIVHRDGAMASLFDGPAMAPVVVDEPPAGWVPDLLRRSMGLPTAAPRESLAGFVEASWLDAVAAEVFADLSSRSDWPTLARLHPLHPQGTALPGPLLAVETQALEMESSWGRMRRLWSRSTTDHRSDGDPVSTSAMGTDVDLYRWFDDGSFARWISRTVPEPEDLLQVILMLVPDDVGSEIADALISVRPIEPDGR